MNHRAFQIRVPDDPRIAHGGGQDDCDCDDCDGEGHFNYSDCCGAAFVGNLTVDGWGLCEKCGEHSSLAKCDACEGTGSRSRESLRAEAEEARAEHLADRMKDEGE